MKMLSNRLRRCAPPLLGMVMLVAGSEVKAQNLTAAQLEVQEANEALKIAQTKIQDLEAKLARAKEQAAAQGERAVNATADAKQAHEEYQKLRSQLEGLGVAALSGAPNANSELQQRLLAALSDLRISDKQKQQLIEALMSLSEETLSLAKATPNMSEEHQQALNKSLAAAEKAVALAQNSHSENTDGDLQNAKIVSIKDGLGIAVLNIGSKQGVHPGMPLTIYRQDKPIARAMVADVRATICGAIVQELVNEKDTVKVGDTGKVEISKS